MGIINFTETDFKNLSPDFADKVQCIPYLPVNEKASLLEITLQKSMTEGGFIHLYISDVLFHLHLVQAYSNIHFDQDPAIQNDLEVYDILKRSGVLEVALSKIPKSEYELLLKYFNLMIEQQEKINNSMAGALTRLLATLPEKIKEAKDLLAQLDTSKMNEVQNLVRVIEGGAKEE